MTDAPSSAVAELDCRARGRARLATLFPGIPRSEWEARPHGMWRAQYGESFVRNSWLYVRLLPGTSCTCRVAHELLMQNDLAAVERTVAEQFARRFPRTI